MIIQIPPCLANVRSERRSIARFNIVVLTTMYFDQRGADDVIAQSAFSMMKTEDSGLE